MRYNHPMRDGESGFTLLEMMVAVVVVSILAALALPSFFGETRKVKATSEVGPMFNDLRVRLEQAMQENGVYPATMGEANPYPAPADQPRPGSAWHLTTNELPPAWKAIKVRISGTDELACSYAWVTGRANSLAGAGPIATALPTDDPPGFGFGAPIGTNPDPSTPNADWFYLLAKCDMDSDPATYSYYFSTSVDASIKKLNEGQ